MNSDSCTLHPFTATLLQWYAVHGRDLPWRHTADPYLIWVSETILQQTRIAQGTDYYLRFVERFPTIEALAAAPEDEVMRQWQGLGYYSRARHLHEAARAIVDRGCFPICHSDILRLPGVGPYTAAAVSSFAYGERQAVVDGNVFRVLSRHFGIDTPIDSGEGKKTFGALAEELLPADGKRCAAYNQAIMDFGALVCTPAAPHCRTCPLSESCIARAEGRVNQLPVKKKLTAVPTVYMAYVRVESQGAVLLHRRTERGIWQSLYDYPLIESTERRPSPRLVHQHPLLKGYTAGGTWRLMREQMPQRLTHRQLFIDIYRLRIPRQFPLPDDYYWIPEERLAEYAMPVCLQPASEKKKR